MEAIAKTRHLKGSPRKARLVIDLIRGRNVSQALAILKFTDKRAAAPIAKTLRSAIANATYLAEQQNIAIDPDELWVKTCFVDMGAHKNRRRMRPAPQGRAYREQRHYCHITIQVTNDEMPANLKKIKNSKNGEEGDKSSGEKRVKGAKASKAENTQDKNAKIPAADVSSADTGENVNTSSNAEQTPLKTNANNVAENEAMASDVKDVTSQRDAEQHETKPADEAQLNRNEELERQ